MTPVHHGRITNVNCYKSNKSENQNHNLTCSKEPSETERSVTEEQRTESNRELTDECEAQRSAEKTGVTTIVAEIKSSLHTGETVSQQI